ncbi:MAG: carboxypeptidase regulatory-like domain-containing protein [Acidobacteria bacterium]|nr:carboxypeptidase regulatory-like domain-containing protein [Acidobacteriota bacterium]
MKVLACLLLGVIGLAAQESRATIIGEVKDSTGAVIAGAKVTAVATATNTITASNTNQAGYFELPYLLPGVYRVEVELKGFKKAVRDGIEVRVSDRMTLDFALEVGAVSDSIVVTGETPLLEAATASLGVVMDERHVAELPVVGGNPFYLSRLASGVLSNGGRSAGNPMDNGAATGIIANGTRGGSSEANVDGAPNMTNRNAVFSPPQDLVQEFKIHTATYDAAIGHAAGASTNVSMKSGGNAHHGTIYYFHSNLRAVPWFTNGFIYNPVTGPINQEKFDRNVPSWFHQRWGVTASGPLRIPKFYDGRNKTFWTYGFEDLNIDRNLSNTATVPTNEERRGDFSALLRAGGARYQIYDPFTIVPAAQAGRFSRQPLPNNVIPASRISPIAQRMIAFYPEANQPGTLDFSQNYFRTRQIKRENYTAVSRIDHQLSAANRLFFRINNSQHDNKTDTLPGAIFEDILDRTGWGAVLDDVHVFSPGVLLNVRYSVSYQSDRTTRGSAGFDITSLGLPASLKNEIAQKLDTDGLVFPQAVVSNYTSLGLGGASRGTTNYHTGSATLTNIRGSHSMRYGAEYRLQRETGLGYGFVNPQFTFGTAFTNGPVDNTPASPKGQGLASMLFGIATAGVINNNASRAEESSYTSFFVHDDWRINPKLTLNVGVRYEYEKAVTERFNRTIRGFDFSTANPTSAAALAAYARSPIPEIAPSAFRTTGGLLFAGANGAPSGLWNPDKNNFAPRIGIAYQINKKTVVRTGYGIFYDVNGVDRSGVNQGGFNQPTNLIASLNNGQTFAATLANPFPNGIELSLGAAGGLSTFLGRGVSYFYDEPLNPYMQRWSFSVQRELPAKTVLDLAYVGNRGTKLLVNRNLNAVPRQYMSTLATRDQPVIDFLSAQVNSPFFGLPEYLGTGLANQRVGRAQLLRPFPHFGDITVDLPAGYSYYHSLQLSAEKRYAAGLTFQLSWTYSKFMEGIDYLNDTDSYLNKVVSPQDFTHRFVLSGIYELPFGRGKKYLGSVNRAVDTALGGWQFQGWFEGQTGDALGFGNAIFNGDIKNIALPLSQRFAQRWFNTDAGFDKNPQNSLANNIRIFPSRFNGVRADGINNFDLSMFKNFRITEKVRTQFRFETYNSLNHVQFAGPNTTPTATAFGTVVDEKGHGQRQVTLSLKLIF